jgi:hypothetical protein
MTTFQMLSIHDQDQFNQWVSALPWSSNYVSSEYVFENLFAWSNEECIQIQWLDQFGIIRCQKHHQTWYFPPVAKNPVDFHDGIVWIFNHDSQGRLIGITDEMLPYVPKNTLILQDDRLSEYIYHPQSFCEMKGTQYHRKRNLIHQFVKKYPYEIKSYQPKDRKAVLDLMRRYHEQGGSRDDLEPLMKAIDHADVLAYDVDLLWVNDWVVALSVGTTSIFNHGVILFEKADIHFVGSYAAISSMFVQRHYAHLSTMTRQEDLGIPEIRHSKLSYVPLKKDRKYAVQIDPLLIEMHALYTESFTEDSKVYVDHFFLNQYDRSRCFYAMIDGHVASGLHLIPKHIQLYGQSFPAPMIVAAATKTEHRHQGFLRSVIGQMLQTLYQQKTPWVTLYPVDSKIYASSGFVTYAYEMSIEQLTQTFQCHLEQTSSTSKLLRIYEQAVQPNDGYMIRNGESFRCMLDLLASEQHVASLLMQQDIIMGYMIHSGASVEEIVLLEQKKPIIASMSLDHVKIPSEQGVPAQMARLIHLESFLNHYRPDPSIIANLSLCVVDPILLGNHHCFQLVAKDGNLQVHGIDSASLTFSIEELSFMILQGTDDARLQGLFPKRRIITFDKY